MRSSVLETFLCCPVDKTYPLQVTDAQWNGEDLLSGKLRCTTCGVDYPVDGGIARLVPRLDSHEYPSWEATLKEAKARDADADAYDSSHVSYDSDVELGMLMGAMDVQPKQVVLDLGAGTGRLSTLLAAKGAHVLAVDISPASLVLNRSKCAQLPGALVDQVVADACYLPFRDTIADGTASGMLLEHIPTPTDRRRFTEEMYRVLKPGAKLALTAYNYSWAKRRRGDREGYHDGGLYYYRLRRGELRGLLSQFRVRTVTGILSRPGRMLRSKLLDDLMARFPPLAEVTGTLLFAVAERRP